MLKKVKRPGRTSEGLRGILGRHPGQRAYEEPSRLGACLCLKRRTSHNDSSGLQSAVGGGGQEVGGKTGGLFSSFKKILALERL